MEIVDSARASSAGGRATVGFGFLCQRRLPLHWFESYNRGKPLVYLDRHLSMAMPILRRGATVLEAAPRRFHVTLLLFVCEGLAQLLLLLLGQVGRDDLEVVGLQLVDHLVDCRHPAGEGEQC